MTAAELIYLIHAPGEGVGIMLFLRRGVEG
jgi:hypothetical protein